MPAYLPAVNERAAGASDPAPAAEDAYEEILPLEQAERRYVQWAARRFAGDRRALAEQLGMSERTLFRKLRDA